MNLEAFIAKAGAEPIASRSRRGPGRVLHAPRDRGLRSRIRWSPASAPMQTRWSRRPTSVCGVHSASRKRRGIAAHAVVPSSAESVESRQNVQSPGTSWASSC